MKYYLSLLFAGLLSFVFIHIPAKAKTEKGIITVAAAANLNLPLNEISALYKKETGKTVTLVFSSSGNLSAQIKNGAPFDLFIAANEGFADSLIKDNYADSGSKKVYAIGRAACAFSPKLSKKIKRLEDLLSPDVKKIAIADPSYAPYGQAAKEALISLGLWDNLKDKFVYGKDIQHSYSLVKSGNTEAGFIALASVKPNEVGYFLIDSKLHKPLTQALCIISSSKKKKEAELFSNFIIGIKGKQILKKYGFDFPK
ncbi:MAG: molybdate ABC transporter substrate-binding protein [Spirochaetes bacterium]|nr:molybdate ABC transporter substrate-binding protein [Spirochaetota bacterium]